MKTQRLLEKTIIFLLFPILATAQVTVTPHPSPNFPPGPTMRINAIAADPSNNIWLATHFVGIYSYDGNNWTGYTMSNSGLPSDSVTSVAFGTTGDVWIGTKAGLARKSGSNWTVYNTGNSGLPSNIITALHMENNTLWIGTHTGLVSYDGNSWITYHTGNSGIPNDSVMVVRSDISGKKWIGTRNGLALLENGNWTVWNTQNSPLGRNIYDIEIDFANRPWVTSGLLNLIGALSNTQVNVWFNGQFPSYEESLYYFDRKLRNYGADITVDPMGNVYFYAGIGSLLNISPDETRLRGFMMPISFSNTNSRMVFDNNGILWAARRISYELYSIDLSGNQEFLGSNVLHNMRTLDIHKQRVGVNVAGDMHWDYTDPIHESPKGSGKQSVFTSAFWIGGLDGQGNLHMAAQTYRQTGFDYWAGPIGGISVPFDSASCIAFDRIWKIDRWKVEEFKNNFLAGNVSNGSYQVPEEITSWPANGNGIVNSEMAPFVDYNGDGLYDPMNGDYPDIKGDQMLYHVFNDSLGTHTASFGAALGIEVRSSSYAFGCNNLPDSLEVLNYTTIYKYEIINRSNRTYNDVYMGFFVDPDLGNAIDDYVGCDSTRAAGFAYNGDNNDETMAGYGMNPPMQNVKILRGPLADEWDNTDNDLDGFIDEPGERCTMNHFMYFDNSNNIPSGNPSAAYDYYNYLRSVWRDNVHLTYGGNGRDTNNAESNFMFSGVPYSGIGWTELISGNTPADRRFVMGSGPISLLAGDTTTIEFAYVFTRDSLNPNGLTTSIARNQADLDRVQFWFENNSFPSCQTFTTGLNEHQDQSLQLYPNPATDYLFLETGTHNSIEISYTIYNTLGDEVMRGITSKNSIYIKNLPPQMYIIKAEIGGSIRVTKFVRKD